MNKKNIDELFRAQFRDFEEIPEEKVWKAIEVSLDKKKSRKVIPIWWKLGGVAAVLAMVFYFIHPFEPNNSKSAIEVTTTSKETNETEKKEFNASDSTGASPYANSEVENNNQDKGAQKEAKFNGISSYANEDISGSTNQSQKNSSAKDEENPLKQQFPTSANDAIVKHSNLVNDKSSNAAVGNKEGIAKENLVDQQEALADFQTERNKAHAKDLNKVPGDNSIAISTLEEQKLATKKEEQKKSIFDEINKEEAVIVENTRDKWSVGPSIAPVYFNGIGTGSPINDAFVSNSKSGDLNLSYGISVAYEVSKKLKIRSGVHKVDYGYATNQIEFKSSFNELSNPKIDHITYSRNSKNIVVNSQVTGTSNSPTFANDVTGKNASLEGSLLQQFGYVEVPLELNYALIDRRFGIDVIGGVSSLFLINNDVLLTSGDQTTEIGEANNINDVNFSTNFGFGVNYRVTPKLQLNVEPMFKYQLHTFSDTSGQFQPFSIGVYSGISFKF